MPIKIIKKPQIKTERLSLKPYSLNDIDTLVEMLTDPSITRTFMVPEFESRDEVVSLAKKLVGFSSIEDTTHLEYGI